MAEAAKRRFSDAYGSTAIIYRRILEMKSYENVHAVITEIKMYLYQIHAPRKFSFGTWTSRQHIFLSIKAGGETGYGENIISVNQPDISLDRWQSWLQELTGKTVGEAIALLRSHLDDWQDRMTEMTEMCLIDLWGKLVRENAMRLLELPGTGPVFGLYVILSDDLDFVDRKIRYAISCGKTRYIKVKLFGKPDLDCEIIKTVRKYLPRSETYLTGDVNCGYRPEGAECGLQEIARCMKRLHEAGLDACEDPAFLSTEEWVELQRLTRPLALIPDYPMRPSRKACDLIVAGMGEFYNIHPGSAASVIDALTLAARVRSLGARLMIGDDSLIGPGCTIWQQLAAGLDADWVEATEKEEESDFYYDAVIKLPSESRKNPIVIDQNAYGFGIYLDEEKLEKAAERVILIR